MDLTALRAEPNYDGTNNLINKGTGDTFETQGYEKARKRFKARQHTQALLGASKAGLIAFGISYAAGLITAKDAVTNTETTGTGTGHAEYNLGKYQQTGYASGNDLTPGLDGFLNNTTNVQS